MGYQARNPYTRPKRIEGVVTLAWPDGELVAVPAVGGVIRPALALELAR